jgi:hypothetical protein
MIDSPRERNTIGAASGFLRLAYTLFPKLTRNITAGVMRKYLAQAEAIHTTPGNVLNPVKFGSSIHGGWDRKTNKDQIVVPLAIIAAVTAGLAAYSKMKDR